MTKKRENIRLHIATIYLSPHYLDKIKNMVFMRDIIPWNCALIGANFPTKREEKIF